MSNKKDFKLVSNLSHHLIAKAVFTSGFRNDYDVLQTVLLTDIYSRPSLSSCVQDIPQSSSEDERGNKILAKVAVPIESAGEQCTFTSIHSENSEDSITNEERKDTKEHKLDEYERTLGLNEPKEMNRYDNESEYSDVD